MRVVTFHLRGREKSVTDSLTRLGYRFGPSREVMTTVLDTFDGRLHRAELRLEVHGSAVLDLVLSGERTVPAHLAVRALPRVAADLPPGPLRSRIAALVSVRALLPQLRFRAIRTSGVWRDAADKIVALVELYEQVRSIDRPDSDRLGATIEVHPMPGYSKHARRTLETLIGLGVARCETDTTTQCAAAVGVHLAGFKASATVPLDPAMSACEGFRLVLDNLATSISANWQGTIDQSDPEFLHDLRIAVRRTRTILGEAKEVLPSAVIDPARIGFEWLSDLTGTPRDLDVYLLEWSSYTDPLGAEVSRWLVPVRDLLERRRADTHVELERALRSPRATEHMGTWHTLLGRPLGNVDLAPLARRPLGPVIAKRIERAHEVLIERGRLIAPDTPAEQVHDLRKDAKKLRYLLECFGGLLPDVARKRYVKRLKQLQNNLGDHQDAEVHVIMLRAIARELDDFDTSSNTMFAVDQLSELLDEQRRAARAEFAERFADYDTASTQRALDAVLQGLTG
jgi:CHAD domain-containing protein